MVVYKDKKCVDCDITFTPTSGNTKYMVKNTVKTTYYNPITKEWDDEKNTPYLRKGWTRPTKCTILV